MSKLFSKLRQLEGAVNGDYNPLADCMRSPSPSANWAFANDGHGLPYGYTALLYGPPKGGKSIICNAMIGQMHQDDPEALAITFNTELRGQVQTNSDQLKIWGIDKERLIVYDVNQPELIFDRIETEINAACQEGDKIRCIVIDSLKGISGRRAMNATSVMTQQIGDEAATLQDGLKRIIPTIRKHRIALLLTTHIRAELDQKEQMRGNTIKMAGAWAAKHMAEYFIYVEPNRSKEGRVSLAGEEFLDDTAKDFMDKSQVTGHKIRFKVVENSLGVKGRTGEFTLDYDKGIINTYEEVFTMGKNNGIITKPSNAIYQYKERTWRGLAAVLTAIRDDQSLFNDILTDVLTLDRG